MCIRDSSWAGPARVLRGYTMSVRSRDYVLAARVAGEKPWRILFVEIFPNLIPLLASQAMQAVIAAILGEAGLSYLGLGATDSYTWGTMLYYAQNGMALILGAWSVSYTHLLHLQPDSQHPGPQHQRHGLHRRGHRRYSRQTDLPDQERGRHRIR